MKIPIDPEGYRKYKAWVIKNTINDKVKPIKRFINQLLRDVKEAYEFIISTPPKLPEKSKYHVDEMGRFVYNKTQPERYTTMVNTQEEDDAIEKDFEKGKKDYIKATLKLYKEKRGDEFVDEEKFMDMMNAGEDDVEECLRNLDKIRDGIPTGSHDCGVEMKDGKIIVTEEEPEMGDVEKDFLSNYDVDLGQKITAEDLEEAEAEDDPEDMEGYIRRG